MNRYVNEVIFLKKNTHNISLVFNEDGKSFLSILEQILKIMINYTEDGEVKCQKKG
jgi:hypothetical protein